jgi:hypothetical protein
MKHSVRISKIKKREVPPGMRKIVVDDKVYFYTIGLEGCSITIINSCRKHFLYKYFISECTWRPKYIAEMIREELKAPSVSVGA